MEDGLSRGKDFLNVGHKAIETSLLVRDGQFEVLSPTP